MAVMSSYRGRACTWRTIKPVIGEGLRSLLLDKKPPDVCSVAGHVGVGYGGTKFLVVPVVSYVVDRDDMHVPLALS